MSLVNTCAKNLRRTNLIHFFVANCDKNKSKFRFKGFWISVVRRHVLKNLFTGKSTTEALFFASINPQYDNGLFIESPGQYMKIPSSEHSQNMFCTQIVFVLFLFWHSEQFVYTTCSESVLSLYFSCTELVIYWTICCRIVGWLM
mgnify:CR=1 FL=1